MKVGYARVSSADQDLAIQIKALEEYGCDKIYQEKRSGTTTLGREQLQECLDFVRDGDELVITRIDRICRNVFCLLYTSPSPRDATLSRMPSSA